jgi:hypothetical protein
MMFVLSYENRTQECNIDDIAIKKDAFVVYCIQQLTFFEAFSILHLVTKR